MNENLRELLLQFDVTESTESFVSEKYKMFEPFVNACLCGEGMIGEDAYLILWNKKDIEELNNDYEVKEFLTNCILIGSDGADTAYGINEKGQYIAVPFIGMDDSEIEIIGQNFEQFISSLYYQK